MSSTSSGNSMSTIARKVLMALSGFFLLFFLLQHLTINFLSVITPDGFNEVSHFMGTNAIIQFVLQPVLAFGVIFHIVMGIVLERQNRAAREIKYAHTNLSANSTWMSRNMIVTGIMVMLFLGLHFYDFWLPEINTKFIEGDMSGLNEAGNYRYFQELQHKFQDPIRVVIYVLAFVFLALHLMHGFHSAFQSVGLNHKRYTPVVKKLAILYAVVVPLGFVVVAVYHFLVQ